MKILITGGAGYLGSVLVEQLLARGDEVTVYDNLLYKQDGLSQYCYHKNFDFIYGDVRDEKKLSSFVEKADVIFPLAAIVGFPACDKDPELADAVNHRQIATICKSLSKNQMVILPQTNSGYGIGKDGICTEVSPLSPISIYGKTKCAGEKVLLDGGNGVSLRLATVFGTSSRMRLDLLVNDFTYKAVKDGYVVLFEKHFKRNYIHIRDVVKAFIFAMNNYETCNNNIYNIGLSDANLSKEELCLKIKEYVPNFSIKEDNIREDIDKRDYIISNAKIEKCGFKPDYSIDDGIKELIKAYRILGNTNNRYTNV